MSAPVQNEEQGERRQREVAQRLFSAEFNASTLEIKEDGTYSPTYVITPNGTRVNRLLAVGVLTSVESVGQSGDRYRAQVVDPTGTFYVYAGQYEPEATQQLMDIRPPAVVAVVGKARHFKTEEGAHYLSVRPETIRAVEKSDRDAWVLEAAKHSLRRLDALKEAVKLAEPTPKAIEDLGYPKEVAEGVAKAIAHYGKPDLAKYAQVIRDGLESLTPGGAARAAAEPNFAPAAAAPTNFEPKPAFVSKPAPAAAKADNPHEGLILSFAEKLDDGKGAPWEDIVAAAAKQGVKEEEVEECLNALMDKGQIYEPVLGRLKRT